MTRAYLKYLGSLLLFGSNGIVAACIAMPSSSIVFWRTLIGSALLITIFIGMRQKFTALSSMRDFACMMASGVSTGLSWIFLYEAYRLAGVAASSLIYYLGPILVMALSPVLFHEPLTARKLACFGVVLVGAVLLNGEAPWANGDIWGLVCAAASAVCHAFMVVFNKLASRVQGLQNPTMQLVVSFATVAVFIWLAPGQTVQLPGADWPATLFLGLVNTGAGCYLYFSSIGALRAQTVVVLGYVEPLSAVVLAVLLLGESMSFLQISGAILVLGGALVAELSNARGKQFRMRDFYHSHE